MSTSSIQNFGLKPRCKAYSQTFCSIHMKRYLFLISREKIVIRLVHIPYYNSSYERGYIMKKSCRRFAKRTLITLAALTAVSTVGFAALEFTGTFKGNTTDTTAIQNLTTQLGNTAANLGTTVTHLNQEKTDHAKDVAKANTQIALANDYAASVNAQINSASSAKAAADSAIKDAQQANQSATDSSNVQ